jgi:hypothetical protein
MILKGYMDGAEFVTKKKKKPFQKPKIFPKFGKIFIEFTIFVPSLEKSLTIPLTKIVTMF